MRLLRLSLTDFRSYAALTLAPGGARSACCSGRTAAARPTCWRRSRCWFPAAACAARATPTCRATARRRLGRRRPFRHGGGRDRYRHRHAHPSDGPARPPRVPPGRRRPAQPGGDRRPRRRRVADAADGPAVPGRLSGRRRFLDRLVWALEPGHAREIGRARRRHGAAATVCWPRAAARTRPGWPAWRTRWPATPWPPRGAHGPGGADERRVAAGAGRLPRGPGSAWPARSPNAWKRRRPWRWRTGCAPASPPTAPATPRPVGGAGRAPHRHGAEPTPRPAPPPRSPAPESRRRC